MHKEAMHFLYPHLLEWKTESMPQGTAAYEKRGIAVDVPEWMPDNCINVTSVHTYALTLLFVLYQ